MGLPPACGDQGVGQRRGCIPVGLHLRNFGVGQPGNTEWFTPYKHHSCWFPLKINTEEGSAKRDHSDKLVWFHIFAHIFVVISRGTFKYCGEFSMAKISEKVQPSSLGLP